ncbi:tRNA (adenosine(37)-N6)-dimethylallyltransferase MiaA [Candidatus Margulisiibacteriota bacterium]
MKPICIIGATAVGKTAYAIRLAQDIGAEIISADSMQVYRYMDIGTAKPSREELALAPHHLINILGPDEPYSVFDFAAHVKQLIPEIHSRNKRVIIAGGTGLYLNALFSGLSFTNADPSPELRAKLSILTAAELHHRLTKVDPVTAEQIHPHNKQRLIRALEVCELTGAPLSEQVSRESLEENYEIIGLDMERAVLYEKINNRVEKMFEAGLLEEVKDLLARGYHKDLQSMQALGYKESIDYLLNTYRPAIADPSRQHTDIQTKKPTTNHQPLTTINNLKSLIKQRTRNFAKRQLTWFRRFKTVRWVEGI